MATATKKSMLVRIHRPRRSQGYLVETYTLHGSGYPKFDWRRGWYEVSPKVAEELSRARNNPNDPSSKPVFQVCTHEEAHALATAEKRQAAEATAPIPMPGSRRRQLAQETIEDVSKTAPKDDGIDLSNDLSDDDWELDQPALPVPDGGVELDSASDDDLEDLDELIEPSAQPKPTPQATQKPEAPKAPAKKKAAKKKVRRSAKKKS